MMSRELGGCVDGRLVVYGTKNVRVVDASAMPTQVSAHLSSTLYAFAEKVGSSLIASKSWSELFVLTTVPYPQAADLIKASQ
jgi:choline dehydrogenase-like flavoprotein